MYRYMMRTAMIFVRFCFSFLERNKYTSENTEGAIKTDNQEKLAKQGTQDEEKPKNITTHYVLNITIRKQRK